MNIYETQWTSVNSLYRCYETYQVEIFQIFDILHLALYQLEYLPEQI